MGDVQSMITAGERWPLDRVSIPRARRKPAEYAPAEKTPERIRGETRSTFKTGDNLAQFPGAKARIAPAFVIG
jgi:hypothetical protein